MARRYLDPSKAGPFVTAEAVEQARERAAAAADRLRAAERADPGTESWDVEYDSAAAAHRTAERRLEALERLHAAQVERAGKRDAAVKAASKTLTAAARQLTVSRDKVAEAARKHLAALADLAQATGDHNANLAGHRAAVAGLGLAVRDELLPEGDEHEQGTLDGGGLRADGLDWIPIPPGALEAFAVRQVFSSHGPHHQLASLWKHQFRPHQVEARRDGLRVPTLKDAGASAAPAPPRYTPPGPRPIDRIEPVLAEGRRR